MFHLNIGFESSFAVVNETKLPDCELDKKASTAVQVGRMSFMNLSIETSSTPSNSLLLWRVEVDFTPSKIETGLIFPSPTFACSISDTLISSIVANLLLKDASKPFSSTNCFASSICFVVCRIDPLIP